MLSLSAWLVTHKSQCDLVILCANVPPCEHLKKCLSRMKADAMLQRYFEAPYRNLTGSTCVACINKISQTNLPGS